MSRVFVYENLFVLKNWSSVTCMNFNFFYTGVADDVAAPIKFTFTPFFNIFSVSFVSTVATQ